MDIRVKAFIDKNYKSTFKDEGFQKFLRFIYEKFISKLVLRNYRMKLTNEAEDLINEIKAILELTK